MKKSKMEKSKNVGAGLDQPEKENVSMKNEGRVPLLPTEKNGITLIALIITIIVMLILVMVTIQVLFNTGLFDAAGKATQKWKEEQDKEHNMQLTIGNKTYGSVEDYIAGEEVWESSNPDYFTYTYDNEAGTATITGVKDEYRKLGYYGGSARWL